jgi:hypothetical protein
MKTAVDEQMITEVKAFGLRFFCDQCAYRADDLVAHSARDSEMRCSLLYPIGERLRPLAAGDSLEFCKEFELE